VHVKKINTWGDESLEKQAAEALIATYNCCVISQHCDSAQPQIVAENKAVFGCGYNSDMTVQAPKAHLVAPVWNWDVYYGTAIRAAIEKPAEFVKTIGNYYGGLKEGFVAISPVSSNCSEGTDKIISAVKDLIISGEWDVFSGAKLSYEKGADGKYTIKKTNAALVKADDSTIVEAGGKSVDDGVIKGSMNYYVKGVTEG
ncbi:MAG: BMP family ABC transporter substrate-binding protein, partial [Clostridia bacterium]